MEKTIIAWSEEGLRRNSKLLDQYRSRWKFYSHWPDIPQNLDHLNAQAQTRIRILSKFNVALNSYPMFFSTAIPSRRMSYAPVDEGYWWRRSLANQHVVMQAVQKHGALLEVLKKEAMLSKKLVWWDIVLEAVAQNPAVQEVALEVGKAEGYEVGCDVGNDVGAGVGNEVG